ncbi:putative 4'-phosphopantetheinyl transferase domain superfamily [Helianthus anomalus]
MKNNILSFAKRYFSREEVEVLSAISDPKLSEAYVKALGIGFSGAPFNTFTIRFSDANTNPEDSTIAIVPLEKQTNLTTNWQFAQLELAGSHYATICRQKDDLPGG